MKPAEITIADRNGNRSIALIDEEDYERLAHFPWEDKSDMRVVGFRAYGKLWCLHRQVLEFHEMRAGRDILGRRVGFLDEDYHNCQKSNLYIFDPGRENRREARKEKLRELASQGIAVDHLAEAPWRSGRNWKNADNPRIKTFEEEPEKRAVEDPAEFEVPAESPPGVRAIRTADGTLVFVDGDDYEALARYDWRDSGSTILRGKSTAPIRLAHEVLQPGLDRIVSYIDGNHLHCWRGNLYAYRRGCKREDRRKAIKERSV